MIKENTNEKLLKKILSIQKERDEFKASIDETLDKGTIGLQTYQALEAIESEIMQRADDLGNSPIYAVLNVDEFQSYESHLGHEGAQNKLKELAELFKQLETSVLDYEHIHRLHCADIPGEEIILVFETSYEDGEGELRVLESVQEILASI